MKKEWLLEGCGAALLFMGPLFYPLLFPGNLFLYHHRFNFANMIGGVFLDMFGIFILYVALMGFLSRLPNRPRRLSTSSLAGLILWGVIQTADSLYFMNFVGEPKGLHDVTISHRPFWIVFLPVVWMWGSKGFAIIIPSLFAIVADAKPAFALPVVRGIRRGLAAFAFCGIWMVPELLHVGFALHPTPDFDHARSQAAPQQEHRIVWILFDELSYKLAFNHPPEGINFPNFQSFHSRSVSFADIQPAGGYTERILPSLFLGREIYRIRSSSKGTLEYFDESHQTWSSIDPDKSLFGTAQTRGWNPAMVGWYNPDCRNYASVLTACSWVPGTGSILPLEKIGASGNESLLANALALPAAFFTGKLDLGDKTNSELLQRDIEDYRNIMAQAQNMIQDGRLRFVYVHLPLPHPPGFYDRRTHKLCECGNYLDNLVLSDDTLGVLLHQIESTPWADETTVIISSDHSWRVPIWKRSSDWTPEEEQVSQDKFDERPVFIIHFPAEISPVDISAPTLELIEHSIINGMLADKIRTVNDLNAFLRQNPAPAPAADSPAVINSR